MFEKTTADKCKVGDITYSLSDPDGESTKFIVTKIVKNIIYTKNIDPNGEVWHGNWSTYSEVYVQPVPTKTKKIGSQI